ncbi:MAG: ATP-binding protein, partial [Ilumatobacteraceae bacterium]
MTDGVREATLARLALLDERVKAAVGTAQLAEPAMVDALRGLVITDQQALRTARGERSGPLASGSLGPLDGSPLEQLAMRLGLDDVELDLLVIAAAPDLDPRYEQLFGYLHDDVTQRRASIGLALRLTGSEPTDVTARRRFGARSPLRQAGLVDVVDESRPFLTRPLRVPDRIAAALLGDHRPPDGLVRVEIEPLMETTPWIEALATSIASGITFVHVEDRPERTAVALAVSSVVLATGFAVVVELLDRDEPAAAVEEAIRETMLCAGGLVIDSADA